MVVARLEREERGMGKREKERRGKIEREERHRVRKERERERGHKTSCRQKPGDI